MLQILRRNFGLKLFAFALALAGWAYFRFLAGPSIGAPFEGGLGVTMHAIPQNGATPCPTK